MSTIAERLARHLVRPMDKSDLARAELHLVDWLACVAGALRSPVAEAAKELDDPVSRAALLGNVLEMDDVHRAALLHPGPVIWSAVLSVSDDRETMLAAAVAGYEAMIALGRTLDAYHYAHWHPTATAGVVGAAAAAGRALGLDEARLSDAIGHAASLAGGLWHMRHGASMTKQVHVLHAAEAGVRCARLAAAGLCGAVGSIEGEQGLYAAMCEAPLPVELRDGWLINQVSFKPWAACRHAHPAIDAALALAGDADGYRVETYRDALTFCDRPHPRTSAEARFSLQHSVAVAVTYGDARPEHFEPEAIAALAPLRDKVKVSEDPQLTARYPAHFGARVSGGGQVVERLDTLGDPERPLTADQHRAKLVMLCDWGGLGASGRDAALAAVADGPMAVRELLAEWTSR